MAIQWLRLWHDMPNDPKWKTIARVSKQPISVVIALYVHLLVIASNATERGRTQDMCSEDLASALDVETGQIEQILAAMQGRVLDDAALMGWEKRQVDREDGSAARAKAWRDAKKAEKDAEKEQKQTHANATKRNQTPDKDTDKDKDKEKKSLSDDKDTLRPKIKPADVCMAMKAEGMQSVNPSHPDLILLMQSESSQVVEFSEAAKQAVKLGKGFAYALGIVSGQRGDALRKSTEKNAVSPSKKQEEKHANYSAVEAM